MKKLSVRSGLRPILLAAAALMIGSSIEWPGTLEGAGDRTPLLNALAMRAAHSRPAVKIHARGEGSGKIANEGEAHAEAPPVQMQGPSLAERLASVLERLRAEAQAVLSGGPAGSAPAAVDAEDPSEAPVTLPQTANRTAVYDIAAHAVYLPNGEKLEAHSGLGPRQDDPRYVSVKNRGPTPPNVYDLALRQPLFHGVRAIRLIPVDDGKMFGRDGMLAHSYMHGVDGQSNGCVVFRDYPAFLYAFLRGDVERLVVVEHLEPAPDTAPKVVSTSAANHFKRRLRRMSRSSARGGYSS
jgi:hypothetical protein